MRDVCTPALYHLRRSGAVLSASEIAADLGWARWRARNALTTLRLHGLVVPASQGNGGNIPTRWRAA